MQSWPVKNEEKEKVIKLIDLIFKAVYNRDMKEFFPRITIDPDVQFGKPVIAHTRVPVAVVVGHLAAGDTIEEIMTEFGLKQEDVLAALKYASKVVGEESVMAR